MANLWAALRGEKRYTIDDWAHDNQSFSFGGHTYPILGFGQSSHTQEDIPNNFSGYVHSAYKANGIVFACVLVRMLVFAEARFQWQRLNGGRPGDLFGSQELFVLERPWPNGTTGELLSRAEQDSSLGGNFYVVREGRRLRRLRPDWVSIILTAPPEEAVASDVKGYRYQPGGPSSRAEPQLYFPEEVAHWSPIPDPDAQYRGMSWITPVVREVMGDKAATTHKLKFFENAATPNLAVSFKETVTEEQFKGFMAAMNESHQGVDKAYKTLYLGGGADVTVVGKDLQQLDFKVTQGAGETRIAAASGVGAVVAQLSEGMQGSSLNAGNYSAARRRAADALFRPNWRSVAASFETLVRVPDNARLWYDDRDIAFLREDAMDIAEIMSRKMLTVESGVRAGYTPKSVVAAVAADDLTLLEHTGLFSVQLQPPGVSAPPAAPAA